MTNCYVYFKKNMNSSLVQHTSLDQDCQHLTCNENVRTCLVKMRHARTSSSTYLIKIQCLLVIFYCILRKECCLVSIPSTFYNQTYVNNQTLSISKTDYENLFCHPNFLFLGNRIFRQIMILNHIFFNQMIIHNL